MSVLLRARISSFLSGVAITGVFAVYQLRKELVESQALLVQQAIRAAAPSPGSTCALALPLPPC